MSDILPPHSAEAERGVLGCVQLDWLSFGVSVEILRSANAFYDTRHQLLWDVLRRMWDTNVKVDSIILTSEIHSLGLEQAVGGLDYVAAMADGVGSPSQIADYCAIVREKYLLRRMLAVCADASAQIMAAPAGGHIGNLLDRVEEKILEVNEDRIESKEKSMAPLIDACSKRIEEYRRGGAQMQGIATGIEYLDKMMLGMEPTQMIVFAARPGMGKTSLGWQIVDHVGVNLGIPCGVFSLEMSDLQLAARGIFARAHADFQKFRTGHLENDDLPKVEAAAAALRAAPIYLDDSSGITVMDLRARARRMVRQYGIKLIMIDYLQLMRPTRFYNQREQEVAEISNGVKALAKDLHLPIVVLAQLNRELEKSRGRAPQLSDLRESGAIEQDADVVGMLYEPTLTDEEEHRQDNDRGWSDKSRRVNLCVVKQRNGPTGNCELIYKKKSMRFISAFDDLPPPIPTQDL